MEPADDMDDIPAAVDRPRLDAQVIDALLALVFTAAALVTYLMSDPEAAFRQVDLTGAALVLLSTAPLALLRRLPLALYPLMLAAVIAFTTLEYESLVPQVLALMAGLFIVTITVPFRWGIMAGVSTGLLTVVAGIWLYAGPVDIGRSVILWVAFSATWLLALIVRLYRETAARERQRALLFARDRDLRAREAVAQERLRLARELHDVVGHGLNIVVLNAQGARRMLATSPETTAEALTAIETAGRQALVDVERMLGVLRAEDADFLRAQPGLRQLDGLARQVTQAGLPVTVTVQGEPVTVPPSIDLSAYRIVQEALTNSLKHAGQARAQVSVRYLGDDLEIEVLDDGRGQARVPAAAENGGGRGIPGMHERVAVFGGRLEVGPRPGGGFRVFAALPLTAASAR